MPYLQDLIARGFTFAQVSYQPSLPHETFLQPRQLTAQQIADRCVQEEKFGEPLPWGLDDSLVVYTIFSPLRDQLWLSAEEGKALFDEMRDLWLKSNSPASMMSALSQYDHTNGPMKKAILVGLGRVCGETWDMAEHARHQDDAIWRSWKETVLFRMLQLVVFVCAVKTLSEQSGQPIKMYAQEPDFELCDEELLRSLGIEILHMPQAESITDHETFVYTPFICGKYTATLLSRCVKHQPGIYVGHSIPFAVQALKTSKAWYGLESKVAVIERLEDYEEERFFLNVWTKDLLSSALEKALGSTTVHIRKAAPTEEEIKQPCTRSCRYVPPPCCG